jgi:hypothetical protein
MKKFLRYLIWGALAVFIAAIALSPLFANLAELDGLDLTPQGYIPLALKAPLTPTPSATPIPTNTSTPVGTSTPTPTATNAPPARVLIRFIEYNPPGDDVPGEFIEITNFGGTAQEMTGWYIQPTTFSGQGEAVLHDPFFFLNYTLEPGNTIRVWTKIGIDSPPTYYWNAVTEIWLNDGDNARLWNNMGQQVDNCEYQGGGENVTCN